MTFNLPDMSDLHYLSATGALKLLRSGALSPVELMEATIQRAQQVGPSINPFADRYFDQAMENAKRSEARYLKGSPRIELLRKV